MSFDTGSISYRLFLLNESVTTTEVLESIRKNVAPPIDTLGREEVGGWVSPRFIFDRDVSMDNCVSGGLVHAMFMTASLKIPPKLLKAYCKVEEIAEMKAQGVSFLSRKSRKEICERVTDDLLDRMPPTVNTIPMVVDTLADRIYAEAISESQQDRFLKNFAIDVQVAPVAMTPGVAANHMRNIDARDIELDYFNLSDEVASEGIIFGHDFLTWLWYFWEKNGGSLNHDIPGINGNISFMLDGPAVFFMDGGATHEISLRAGVPLLSPESNTAILAGKKLAKVRFIVGIGDETYSASVDGSDFSFRGLKLPKNETDLDPDSILQNRVHGVRVYTDVFYHLFGLFLDAVMDKDAWALTVVDIKNWIAGRVHGG